MAVAALGGSERRGQLEMAAAVTQAFETGEHLIVQAGTGTGKSLAYLIPAIVRSLGDGSPVVVSTATIAQWGQDPLPLANIELFSRAATQQRAWAPQPMA